ncbi:hypothetical protein OIU77_023735, partial [Salix suchowensis]
MNPRHPFPQINFTRSIPDTSLLQFHRKIISGSKTHQ